MTAAFLIAMDALEEAHRHLIAAHRSHAANLMSFGLTPGEVEPGLAEIDELESSLEILRQRLREAADA